MRSEKLVLWDVDHTLISTVGIGREVFAAAFQHATGHRMQRMAEVWGRTEPVIFTETAKLHGIDDPDAYFDIFAEAQAEGYRHRADEMRARGYVLPGVVECLAAFAAHPEIAQGVLTGNPRISAEVKLRAFGLHRYLDLGVSAYGSDDADRARLVTLARHRAAARYGITYGRTHTILIGDTLNDVSAACQGGARALAVASGRYNVDELEDAGAEAVFADLTRTDAITKAVLR